MKIYSIIAEQESQVQNAQDLANAFDETQWLNIIAWFLANTERGRMYASANERALRSRMREINGIIGKGMPTYMNEWDWNSKAKTYGMNHPSPNSGFAEIYQLLAPKADIAVSTSFPNLGADGEQDAFPGTEQSLQNILDLIPNAPDQFTTVEEIDSIFNEILPRIMEMKGEEFANKFRCAGPAENVDHVIGQYLTMIYNKWKSNLPVTKEKLAQDLFGWIRRADREFANPDWPECPI